MQELLDSDGFGLNEKMKISHGHDFPYHVIRLTKNYFTPPPRLKSERGNKTLFWHSSWLNGSSPKNIAPQLFVKVKRKNITAQKALHNNHWVDLVYPLETGEEIREYAKLWDSIHFQERDINGEDEIFWRWTSNREYTIKSAYQIQFTGHTSVTAFHPIWKAKTEPKCRFFAWILLQKRS